VTHINYIIGFSYGSIEWERSVIIVPASLKTVTPATANKIERRALQNTERSVLLQ